jgi:hypothetical protein
MQNENDQLEEGQGMFCDIIKTALYQEDPTIFEHLDFYKDVIFLEPTLFGYCTQKEAVISKEQLLFGYYANEHRPIRFEVQTNSKGVLYLPNYTYLKTAKPNCTLTLRYNRNTEVIMLKKEREVVDFELDPLQYLGVVPTIEITGSIDVYSEQLIASWPRVPKGAIDKVLCEDSIDIHLFKPAIEEALRLLKTYFRQEFERYAATTRRIVLFSSSELRNFATREAHGTIYLNVNEDSTVAFFLEELIHQCSHTIFNAMTCDIQSFFLVDGNLPVGDFIEGYDFRTLYGALHGIYTTGRIVDLFLKLMKKNPPFEEELLHELKGRIAINKKRHNIGLEQVALDVVFTEKGKTIFNFYYKQLDKNIQENPSFFEYNMKNHPVVFNYQKFKEDNPLVESPKGN